MRFYFSFFIAALSTQLFAQNPIPSTDGKLRDHKSWISNSVNHMSNYNSTNIGPTIMSGRISDIEVNPENPTEFFVSYASGGLWYTDNNGTTFKPVFDNQAVMTIGAFAVEWRSGTIYVGTGEVNSSRSSYAGNGVYKSTDKGKSWQHLGLEETHHIGQVWISPNDVNHVVICALGHLYSPNPERGIFVTTDGGKNWKQTLAIDDNTGAVDMIVDLEDNNVLYASTWHRERRAWNFIEGGTTSSIYKSTNKGLTWEKIIKEGSGFPQTMGSGRIGLAQAIQDKNKFLYAIIDNYDAREKKTEDKDGEKLTKKDFKIMTKEAFSKLKDDDLKNYLEENDFPKKYTVKKVRDLISKGKISVASLGEYLDNANTEMEDVEVKGAEVYVSKDGGATWSKTHKDYIDGLYITFGYYFGQIRAQQNDPNILYILGVPLLKSNDGGMTWKSINGDNMHGDHHSLWINPKNPLHLINGNDGGINISYDGGENWIKCNMPAVGQFYAINVDNEEPYNVYGGLQDNGVWYGKHTYKYSNGWHDDGQYPYKFLMGGDGMQIQIDNRDNNTVYTGFQFGNYYRINKKSGERKYITPKHELGDSRYRWNWQTPILLSPHNQDILYMGANKLLRSMDKGETFKEISGDLTNGGIKGDVPYGTITSFDESVLKFGLIYVGSDDGRLHITQDGGNTWKDIGKDLPKDLWVSRVQASMHEESRVYLSLNGYRWDNFNAYVFMSDDYGQSWKDIGKGLPNEPVNVIKEDFEDEDILYVGTDNGLYISFDRGLSYQAFANIPRVAVHDLVIQKKANHLLIGTHGRSIYKADLAPVKKYKEIKDKPLYVYEINKLIFNETWGKKFNAYSEPLVPKSAVTIFSSKEEKASIELMSKEGKVFQKQELNLLAGLHTYEVKWEIDKAQIKEYEKFISKDTKNKKSIKMKDDMKYYPELGTYKVKVSANGISQEVDLKIEENKN